MKIIDKITLILLNLFVAAVIVAALFWVRL